MAAGVACRVLRPARDRKIPPAAVARARRREHHRVLAVREQVRAWRRLVGSGEATRNRAHEVSHVGRRLDLLGARPGYGHVARRPLLQQQLGGLHDRLAVEARSHRAAVQHVRDRDDRHALVVRHVGPHGGDRLVLQQSLGRVVERLVEPVRTACAEALEPRQVLRRRGGVDHRRQRRRIGRDHEVLAEPALQAQPRHPEVRVLVRGLEIARVEGRLEMPHGTPRVAA